MLKSSVIFYKSQRNEEGWKEIACGFFSSDVKQTFCEHKITNTMCKNQSISYPYHPQAYHLQDQSSRPWVYPTIWYIYAISRFMSLCLADVRLGDFNHKTGRSSLEPPQISESINRSPKRSDSMWCVWLRNLYRGQALWISDTSHP